MEHINEELKENHNTNDDASIEFFYYNAQKSLSRGNNEETVVKRLQKNHLVLKMNLFDSWLEELIETYFKILQTIWISEERKIVCTEIIQ